MAHIRHRLVSHLYGRLIKFSPIVGVFGHRQVGKSTLISSLAKAYFTLDDQELRENIGARPKLFLQKQARFPTAIDECQYAPELFPALKEWVRTHKQPGQFILSGSVRFTSRKAIRESLAGRIVHCELLPFILAELREEPLPDLLPNLIPPATFNDSVLASFPGSSVMTSSLKHMEKYLLNGGLPGLCFVREERLRREAMLAIHQLILDRDLRMIVNTRLSIETLMNLLRLIAKNGWQPYNASEVKRQLGLSHQTQKLLLLAFESIFLIRRIAISGRAGEIILLEDQYEERVFSDASLSRSEQLLSLVFRNCRAQFFYRLGMDMRIESYWTRSGARVPLVFRTDQGALGLIAVAGEAPTLSQRRAADSFLRHSPTGKVLFITDGVAAPRILDPRILICPAAALV